MKGANNNRTQVRLVSVDSVAPGLHLVAFLDLNPEIFWAKITVAPSWSIVTGFPRRLLHTVPVQVSGRTYAQYVKVKCTVSLLYVIIFVK